MAKKNTTKVNNGNDKVRDGYFKDLPEEIQNKVMNISKIVRDKINDLLNDPNYEDLKSSRWAMSCIDEFILQPTAEGSIGSIRVFKKGRGKETYSCMIQLTGHFRNHQYGWIEELLHEIVKRTFVETKAIIRKKYDMTIKNEGDMGNPDEGFDVYPSSKVAEEMWNKLEDRKTKTITESINPESNPDYNKEYNTDMTEKQAKQTLRTLSQSIINNYDKDDMGKGKNKINQYTANIYANIITKNLLPKWAPGFKKLSIILDSYQSFFTFEFKTPTMSQDFVSRFIEGREQISGFLHRVPEIKIRMSPRIFHTMKNADDAYNFFKSAITYYNSGLEKTSVSLMVEARKLGREMKHLISTTKLSGIVTLPLSLLFVFEDVHMDNKDVFRVNKDDIKTINQFMKNIYTRYAAPEKEKSKIINDVREMVKELRESCGVDSDTMRDLYYFPEAVEIYFNGGYDNEMRIERERFELEQVDMEGTINPVDPQSKYYMEKFGVKKLKKIPTDLVAYISIETEAIKDANDKMMIASYTLGKIEIVEWYIELLEVGSKKYIVPHSKPYLENVRTQLLACFKKIMDTPIPKNDRPIMDIKYPKGYEG